MRHSDGAPTAAAAEPVVGTVLTLPGSVTAELAAEPFDIVWIDLEHGALDRSAAQELILGAQAAGARAFARVGVAGAELLIGPMLDAGADGIVAADVRDEDQARHLTRLVRHPPEGRRGYGPRRATLRHRTHQGASHVDPELWLQIESRQGVEAAGAIARTPGVHALVVGIADLCVDLGIPIGLRDMALHESLTAVRDAATENAVIFGIAGPLDESEDLAYLLGQARVLVHSTDARIFAAALDSAADALRLAHRHATAAINSFPGSVSDA